MSPRTYNKYEYDVLALMLDEWLNDGHRVTISEIIAYLEVPHVVASKVVHLHRNPIKGLSTHTRALVCEAGLGSQHGIWSYWITVDPDEIERHGDSLMGRGFTTLATALEQIKRSYELSNKRSGRGKELKRTIIDMERVLEDISMARDNLKV